MLELTCCLMNWATGRMNNWLNSMCVTIAFMNVSKFDHRYEHSDIMWFAALKINGSITIVFRKGSNYVLIPFLCCIVSELEHVNKGSLEFRSSFHLSAFCVDEISLFRDQIPSFVSSELCHDVGDVATIPWFVVWRGRAHRIVHWIIRKRRNSSTFKGSVGLDWIHFDDHLLLKKGPFCDCVLRKWYFAQYGFNVGIQVRENSLSVASILKTDVFILACTRKFGGYFGEWTVMP